MAQQAELFSPDAFADSDDVIIIGGGLAGLFCALKMAPRPVTVLAAAPIGTGASSAWAQAGIAAAVSEGDTVDKHLADTIEAGAGIVDQNIAALMVGQAADRIHDLLDYGVPFDTDLEGRLVTSREAAHSENRVVRVKGDMAGKAIMGALVSAVHNTPSIRLLEGYVAEELVMSGKHVAGLIARPDEGRSQTRIELKARAVVIATGGVGALYEVTTNPKQARGGGAGMAARAGAVIADPEFVQFHPTAINMGKDPAPLATEALRGEGCTLHNDAGERFMVAIDKDAEMAPRDIVARAIFDEIASGRGAWLDCTKAVGDQFKDEFPTVYGYCQEAGIDPSKERIPIIPAVHYHMGGILTDADGRTSLDGLWACGEVTSTGAHGANRLASNSLLEAVVFSSRIADDIVEHLPVNELHPIGQRSSPEDTTEPNPENLKKLRATMSKYVGVVRTAEGMKKAISIIVELSEINNSSRFTNALATAKMITVAALLREESRGGHFRTDFPDSVESWKRRTFLTLAEVEKTIEEMCETA